MKSSLDSTDIGIAIVDRDLRIRGFTPAIALAGDLVQRDTEPSIDRVGRSLDLGDDSLRQLVLRVLKSRNRIQRKIRNHEGRLLWMRILPYCTETSEAEGVVLIFVDATTLPEAEEETAKRAQENLDQYAARLERSHAELQRLAYVAAHDLREPLRTISGFCDLLQQRYGGSLDDQADKWIDFITDGCRQMQQLIDDLTVYSRVESRAKPPEDVEANGVVDEVMTALRPLIDEAGAVITREELPTLVFEPTHLKQLLHNLIANAIKYRGDHAPRIHVAARSQSDEWVLSVCDNGIGIKPQFHERIFEISKRLHSRAEYPGTGMGLAICRKIIERAGGKIWVESELGGGSTFFFSVPKSASAWQVFPRPDEGPNTDERS